MASPPSASYRGAQVFEAVGLDRALSTPTSTAPPPNRRRRSGRPRPGGRRPARQPPGLRIAAAHRRLETAAEYSMWRREAEPPLFDPDRSSGSSTHSLAPATTSSSSTPPRRRAGRAPADARASSSSARASAAPISMARFEAGLRDRQRFSNRCHVLGFISLEAHQTLAIAMNPGLQVQHLPRAAGRCTGSYPPVVPRQAGRLRPLRRDVGSTWSRDDIRITMAQRAKPAMAATARPGLPVDRRPGTAPPASA